MNFVPSFCRNFVIVSPKGKFGINGSGLCQIEDCMIIDLDRFSEMNPEELKQLQKDATRSRCT